MKVKLNLSNFNNDFQSDSEISNLNSTSDSLIPIGKSGIHIKKENRGKFTEYCGGKVTDACIRKAKASGNPKLIKRATFAANARKWKHQQGGTIADLKIQLGETPWVRHKTFEEYDSLGRPIYNRYDSFYSDEIEQMQEGGPLQNVAVAESTKIIKPTIVQPKKVLKNDLSNESWEQVDNEKTLNLYPNLKNDKYVQEFYQYDYAPRFLRLNKFAPQQYVNAAKNIYKTTPINIYYEDSGVGGYKTGGERRKFNNAFLDFGNRVLLGVTDKPASIYLNGNYKLNRPTIIHELAHAFRQGTLGLTGDRRFSSESNPIYSLTHNMIGTRYEGSGYTSKEEDMLHDTYNMSHYLLDYDEVYEKGTTNTEVRFRLWKQLYDKLGRRPTLLETDNYIKNYNGENLKTIIRDANGYGHQMYENGLNVNDVKNTLINVAQNNPLKEEEDAYVSYARKGGKINAIELFKQRRMCK